MADEKKDAPKAPPKEPVAKNTEYWRNCSGLDQVFRAPGQNNVIVPMGWAIHQSKVDGGEKFLSKLPFMMRMKLSDADLKKVAKIG